jgi:acyl-homoserine-lactone acylase
MDRHALSIKSAIFHITISTLVLLAPWVHSDNYAADIKRTQYGIPHITANDWGSLGFGYGFAFAQDNYCTLLRGIIAARGESARWFGEAGGDVESDFIYTLLNGDEARIRREWIDVQPQYVQRLVKGYADGLNHYVDVTGIGNLPRDCRNARWVSAITDVDILRFLRRLALQASTDNPLARAMIMATRGPAPVDRGEVRKKPLSKDEADAIRSGLYELRTPMLDVSGSGSNAYALGRQATQSGRGMLLGNPHYPWQGTSLFYEVHLTYPGVYDVMGASLFGMPMVNAGFNRNIAWTHTVSVAARFSFFELKINPDNLLQYQYGSTADGVPVWRNISVEPVSIKVRTPGGALRTRTHTFYRSHHGFIMNLSPMVSVPLIQPLIDSWPMGTGTLLAMRDANETNTRGITQWVTMGQAGTLEEFTQSLAIVGIPWLNTVAVDRGGKAFYGDISVVPHIDDAKFARCSNSLIAKVILSMSKNQIVTLNGADPACEWGEDTDAPAGSNIFGYSSLPKLLRDDYVANSNDSYWLSNPQQPLTGFPKVMSTSSAEGAPQLLRTTLAHEQVAQRLAGTDGLGAAKFTLENLQQVLFSSRVLGAERTLDDMLEICARTPFGFVFADDGSLVNISRACEVLAGWDRTVTLDAVGAQIFTETWNYLAQYAKTGKQWFWDQPFDPANPIATPSGLNKDNYVTRHLVLKAIGTAVRRLQKAGVELDAPWRDVQYVTRNGEDIPLHGGSGPMGAFSVITAVLEPGGYRNVIFGNTYIQTVTWDDSACPIAYGMLATSQSTDPDSPFYSDQTKAYSQGQWPKLPFCASDIKAMQIGDAVRLEVEMGDIE